MKKIITLLSISVPLTAVADNARIDAFMTAFHANPQKVMDALPEKEGDEYQTMSAEELERFRDQMRETVMERAEPVIAPRFSANLNNDNPARLVDVGNALFAIWLNWIVRHQIQNIWMFSLGLILTGPCTPAQPRGVTLTVNFTRQTGRNTTIFRIPSNRWITTQASSATYFLRQRSMTYWSGIKTSR